MTDQWDFLFRLWIAVALLLIVLLLALIATKFEDIWKKLSEERKDEKIY